ncbi:hypothetical protein LTR08_004655 [Meristemomyces frigidus]|nr:hypothetical protein LTR08_004655 [Meristemomyces frigidus]
MRQSFFASALCLSLISSSDARVHRKLSQLETRNANAVGAHDPRNAVAEWFSHLFKRVDDLERRDVCKQDQYYNFVNNSTFGQTFCNAYLDYPTTNVTVEYTPTSTFQDVYTTNVVTATQVIRTTPGTTVTDTVTAGAKVKRDPQITARARLSEDQVADVFAMFRRQAGDVSANASASANGSVDNAQMSASFSSACSCQTYGGETVTETYTNEPTVVTLSEFTVTTTTVTSVRTARPLTSTAIISVAANTTVALSVTGGLSGSGGLSGTGGLSGSGSLSATIPSSVISSSVGAPTPTAPAFTCPDDDSTTVSQMVNAERFDYMVLCGTDLTDPTFYGSLYYSSFSACVAACSTNDYSFQSAVCQGVSYYNEVNQDGYNCFLKTASNHTVPAVGVDSALLLRIVVGVTANDTDGTSTESVAFATATPTYDPSQMSSSVSSIMGNSTSSMPMVTPGPPMPQSGMLVNSPSTSYSTYISDGSTYSSGSAFYTSYTSNGSWYVSYYTSYTLAWASATTEYAVSSQETSVSSSNNSAISVQGAQDGGHSDISQSNSTVYYPGGYNVTEVTSNTTYAVNGTEISSTAVTSYFSYATGSASGGASGYGGGAGNGSVIGGTNGTGEGGASGGASGLISSGTGPVTSTYPFSTQTLIVNSGGAAGASGYQASGALPVSTETNVVIVSGGTAYGSGYVASGMAPSTLGGPAPTGSVVVSLGGTAYGSGFVASGKVSSTVIIGTAGTAYSSGFLASGGLSGSPSPSYSFGNTDVPRVGTGSSSAPLSTASGPPPFYTGPVYSYGTPSVVMTPSPAPSYGFSNGDSPRVGTDSSIFTPSIIQTISYSPSANPGGPINTTVVPPMGTGTGSVLSAGPSPYPTFNNTGIPSAPMPTGTLPPGYSFSNTDAPRSPYPIGSGTAPLSYMTAPISSGSPLPTVNSTVPVGPTNTSPASYSFGNTDAPRSPFPTGTAPSSFSTAPATCANLTMATTTIYATSTIYGCYDTCLPQAGGYGGPQSFGAHPTGAWGPPS